MRPATKNFLYKTHCGDKIEEFYWIKESLNTKISKILSKTFPVKKNVGNCRGCLER